MKNTLLQIIEEHGDLSKVCKGQLSIPIGIANAKYCTMAKSHYNFECKCLESVNGYINSCRYNHQILNNGFKEYHLEIDCNLGDC